jgi:uncharacterized membrane protein
VTDRPPNPIGELDLDLVALLALAGAAVIMVLIARGNLRDARHELKQERRARIDAEATADAAQRNLGGALDELKAVADERDELKGRRSEAAE